MANTRGRAAQSIRPGSTIKRVLLGEIPLKTGELVHEASITDIYVAYKGFLRFKNESRPQEKKLKGMNLLSFTTLFKFARYLGLVEHVRDEPRHEPSYGNLHRVENGNGLHIVPGTRRIFRLTDKGRADDESWNDLCGTWRKQHRGNGHK
jgi:hypothetical protein